MYKLVCCCLLWTGVLHPLLSLPVIDSGDASPLLPAAEEDATSALGAQRAMSALGAQRATSALGAQRGASALQLPPEVLGAARGDPLREADPSTDIFTPRGNTRKAFSGKDPNVLLSKLLARTRKQHRQQGTRAECFWKYCV